MFSKDFIHLIFNTITAVFLIYWLFTTIKEFIYSNDKAHFFQSNKFSNIKSFLLLIGLPYVVFNYTNILTFLDVKIDTTNSWLAIVVSIILSIITTLIWMDYILKLDVFEKEKKRDILLTFLLGTGFTFLTFPMYDLVSSLNFSLNGKPLHDFLYCVFGIGLIEETVKFIPLLIILKFRKNAINEPYDFILYASISALGFAFAENILYLKNRGIEIILARTFYATVAHMTFSSTIAYGMVLYKYLKPRIYESLFVGFFFLIAMTSHGFYNFWLLNPVVSKFSGLTTLFFLITVHIWFTMKNNLINLSNFYDESKTVNNSEIKEQLVKNLLGIIGFLYIYVAFSEGLDNANAVLYRAYIVYGYVIIYLAINLSKYKVVKGYLKPFQIPFNIFIPKIQRTKNPFEDGFNK